MGHAVHYRTAAGETKVEEVGTLDAAVSMVERLRNDEGVSDVRVYREIPIEFKAYYKVSVVEEGAGGSPANDATTSSSTESPAPPQPQAAAPAPQSPPPGAMPLGPSTPTAQPSAQASATPSAGNDEGDSSKRGSLFSRG